MHSRLKKNRFVSEREESENSPENSADFPFSGMFKDAKIASTSASKRSREATQKRVVSVPIKDKLKGDQIASPPSDSWAWRKYGQKPIKGSPYPRGYYKCSSSKGCPARKQVERSKIDPNMLVVTYSCQHNHPWPPASRNNHRTAAAASVSQEELEELEEEKPVISSKSHEMFSEEKFINIGEGSLINGGEFGWFSDLIDSTSCMESSIITEERISMDNEMAMIFTMREEDESSLFADLGELPECSTEFRRGMAERRRCSLATTG